MATTDNASPALSTATNPDGREPSTEERVEGASATEAPNDPPATSTTAASSPSVSASNTSASTSQAQSAAQPSRPSLVSLGSSQSSLSTTTAQPKKFSAVNVNKKFLEKTAQAATAPSSTASTTKSSAAIARPAATPATSHSRLVTAKLTASPVSSTAGWSRPASVAPTANTSPNSTSPLPTSAPASNPGSAAPQLPHVGKVIQPQPKSASQLSTSVLKDSTSAAKPVWGNPNPPSAPVRYDIPSEDFPTAAEAVKGTSVTAKKPKSEDTKAADAAKQARLEDADAFRGVHLDPNAHHWDEMEEDDDDFLGGVVEFGDGRQYKVESVEGGDKPTSPGPEASAGNVRDRFVDDFDRSWPKSRTSPLPASGDLPAAQDASRSPTTSVNGLHPSSSPVESSRVLFNERSNRLEPYNHSKTTPPSITKRGFLDNDGRQGFNGASQNIQVLHKSSNDFASRNRRFSGASNGSAAPAMSPRDSYFPRRDGPPPSPRMSRDGAHLMAPSTSQGGRDRDGGKRGAMGPPPVPSRALKSAQESGRQLPPHLAHLPPSRREPRQEPPTPASSKAPSLPSQSPLLGTAPLSAVSPVLGTVAGLPLPPGANLEEVRKDVMHNAAARAKARREQEEAEREAQKERARKKAQELEEKMKAAALEKEKREKEAAEAEAKTNAATQPSPQTQEELATSFIEDAVRNAKSPASDRRATTAPVTAPNDQAPSRPAPFAKATSWRSNVPSAPPIQQRRSSSGFVASATTALDAAVDAKKEDLEVVDFSDMSKLVDGGRPQAKEESVAPVRSPRPSASDFFEDKASSAEADKPPSPAWRRKSQTQQPSPPLTHEESASPSKAEEALTETSPHFQTGPSFKESLNQERHDHPSSGPARTPRGQTFFKEAAMSSLDDTMSRIKGVIGSMKHVPTPADSRASSSHRQPSNQATVKPPFREKWVPPALRPRHVGFLEDEEREVFDVTIVALPPSPPPSSFLVELPKVSHPIEPIHKKQLQLFHRFPLPARFEILSFEPPVEGMSRRDFSVNDVLFRKPGFFKGKTPRYRVYLPRRQPKPALRGFGKTPLADTTASWRKPASTAKSLEPGPPEPSNAGLETMTRSPPPDTGFSDVNLATLPKSDESVSSKAESLAGVKTRPQPKMPAGSSVAVLRDSRIDVIEGNVRSSVNFIVSDELEEAREPAQTVEDLQADVVAPTSTSNGSTAEAVPTVSAAVFSVTTTTETKSSEGTNQSEQEPPQADQQSSPWSRSPLNAPPLKESTSRGPDPEHLKALWSQPPEKSDLHPVNSLEAIPDDLTSLPFTLQEVKSEDGATPPPAPPQPPSRMSLHEVRRAFQQVPESSSSSSATPARPPISPPSTNAPVARPTTGYSYAPPNGMRPVYGSYPSPISSHSPAPMLYSPHPPPMNSSPVPARMGPWGGQWVPVMPPTAPNGMRPPPYPTSQMMPYSPSPPASNVYPQHSGVPPNMMPQHPHQSQPQHGSPAHRNRSMPGMSPAMSQAPMYPTSPMLMHAHPHPPVMQGPPQNHGYAPMPAGRNSSRTDTNGSQLGHQQHPPPSQVMYPSVPPSAPFARSGW